MTAIKTRKIEPETQVIILEKDLEEAYQANKKLEKELKAQKEIIEQLRKSLINYQHMLDNTSHELETFKSLLHSKYPQIFYEILDATEN